MAEGKNCDGRDGRVERDEFRDTGDEELDSDVWDVWGKYERIVGGDDSDDINALLLEVCILLHIRRQMLDLTSRGKRTGHSKQDYFLSLESLAISIQLLHSGTSCDSYVSGFPQATISCVSGVYGMYLNCTEGNVSPTFKGIAIDWEPW
jgi:hypothetical protein